MARMGHKRTFYVLCTHCFIQLSYGSGNKKQRRDYMRGGAYCFACA